MALKHRAPELPFNLHPGLRPPCRFDDSHGTTCRGNAYTRRQECGRLPPARASHYRSSLHRCLLGSLGVPFSGTPAQLEHSQSLWTRKYRLVSIRALSDFTMLSDSIARSLESELRSPGIRPFGTFGQSRQAALHMHLFLRVGAKLSGPCVFFGQL